jgi:periplasmic divalent cation tolerance protein
MTDKIVVLITCGSGRDALQLARALVKQRLAACVNTLTAPVHSVYRWQGKMEEGREHLLLIKTTRRRFPALRDAVTRLHKYSTPEVIALPVATGSRKYLAWLAAAVTRKARE